MIPESPSSEIVTPSRLYSRWEKAQWAIADLDIDADVSRWQETPKHQKTMLLNYLLRAGHGERKVAAILAPLAYAAPREDAALFLCTQLADEARHTLFFLSYIRAVTEDSEAGADARMCAFNREASPAVGGFLDRTMVEAVERARGRPGEAAAWFRAVAVYHLVGEGSYAMYSLQSISELASRPGWLPALRAGMTNVLRDEARHVAFGVWATRRGVEAGYGRELADAILSALAPAVRSMATTDRRDPMPRLPAWLHDYGRLFEGKLRQSRRTFTLRLESCGLGHLVPDAESVWEEAVADGMANYERETGRTHPIRMRAHSLPADADAAGLPG